MKLYAFIICYNLNMNDNTSNASNMLKSKNYITVDDAAKLVNSPSSYIEFLCNDNQIEHAYDKDGNFVVELESFLKVLSLDNSKISEISFVDNSNITDNSSGLPAHWLIKTNKNVLLHHEDLPLFPQVKPKILIEDKDNVKLIDNDTKELIDSSESDNLITSPIVSNLIEDNLKDNLLSSSSHIELESGVNDKLIESGKVDENNLLLKSNIENTSDNKESISKDEAISYENSSFVNQKNIDNTAGGVISEKKEIKEVAFVNPNIVAKNLSNISPTKILSVPRMKIDTAIPSSHPLANPPIVFPISTNTPSLKTKIAAIYTQPEAMASKWLPWMRTSMWPRKTIKRAISSVKIMSEDTNENTKLALVQSPKIQYQKQTINRTNSINSYTPNIHMGREIKKEIKEEPKILQENVFEENQRRNSAIKIDDSLDSALFTEFAVNINQREPKDGDSVVFQKEKMLKKPVINDSWDSMIFG